ncbi:MAG: hypothetical protein D6731_17930 [Planctomycetota bacterium]|nr:MAG: hypothetical protein D6731_17930 [Planctomycetota bacterium]
MRNLASLPLLVAGVLLAAPEISARPQVFDVAGLGVEDDSVGTSWLTSKGHELAVTVRTFSAAGTERWLRAKARFGSGELRLSGTVLLEGGRRKAVRGAIRPVSGERGTWVVRYRDASGAVVRREFWRATRLVRVPVQVIALANDTETSGVSPGAARRAQGEVIAQLDRAFRSVGLRFLALGGEPARVPLSLADRDGDGALSAAELRGLRDELELRGLKRRGRVVLVLTAAPFAHPTCRGWTLGDAPPSPATLDDPNDNFSVVGLRYLDARRYHTVAHEVAHQLGLDDLNALNRRALRSPKREDHLMISGGRGSFIDPAVARLLSSNVWSRPAYGLEGRLGTPLTGVFARRAEGDSADARPSGDAGRTGFGLPGRPGSPLRALRRSPDGR